MDPSVLTLSVLPLHKRAFRKVGIMKHLKRMSACSMTFATSYFLGSALPPARKRKHSKLLPVLCGFLILWGFSRFTHAQCSNPLNAIVAENCLPGNPASQWDILQGNAGSLTIQGFATDISFNQGATVTFKISTPAKAYTVDIYRMGYYGGLGARRVATIAPSASLPQIQPSCLTDASVGLTDCGNWAVSASWQIPSNATSGIYFAHLIRTDTGGDSHIVFIVRNDSSHSAIVFQTADGAWQAYNSYGLGSLYGPANQVFDLNNRSFKVSYNRPVLTRGFDDESATWVFGSEFPMVQWLEQNGYDVTYFTGVDAARSGSLLLNHKLWIDSGHDEYWSGPARDSVEAARDSGVNLAFFSGNEAFWKTRFESSIDGTNSSYRTLVCYKETLTAAKIDPVSPSTWTGTWRDPRFSPPADGGRPENQMTGNLFMVNGPGVDNDGSLQILVPAADGAMRFWRNTAISALAAGATYKLPVGSLAYEWDSDIDNGFRPSGVFHLSSSTYAMSVDYLLDFGATYGAGAATHHLQLYRAKSGALVFGAGTVNWAWGLSSNHDNPFSYNNPAPDANMQQATVNLFADMGVQPASLQLGLTPATPSADTIAPVSTITAPAQGAVATTDSVITVSGTATDRGGAVAAVEVSFDGGGSWHPAVGRGSWNYAWTPTATGSATLLSRAVDDSGNLETPGVGVTVNALPPACPCSIFGASSAPSQVDSGDGTAIEVGVRFRSESDGSILGLRFYKTGANTGTHIGHLWSNTGALLGTVSFVGESGSGWQQVNFNQPIAVSANTTYVASYYAPSGHYSVSSLAFQSIGTDNPPLHALKDGLDGGNGTYLYSSGGGFPHFTYNSANYWVDVVYSSAATYTISGAITGPAVTGITVSLGGAEKATTTTDSTGAFSFGGIITGSYTVNVTKAGITFNPASQTVTISQSSATGVNFMGTLTNPLSITGVITGVSSVPVILGGAASATLTTDSNGNFSFSQLLGGTYTLTPVQSGSLFTPNSQSVILTNANVSGINFTGQVCNCLSLWSTLTTPSVIDSGDRSAVELGVTFQTDTPGMIIGLRFYKAAANTGTHIGHLWSSSGALLGSAAFTSESATGWQQVNFSSPVAIQAHTNYVASYYAPAGHYSADSHYFAGSGVDNGSLHANLDGAGGSNGLYVYASGGAFPTTSYYSTNYWVDVLYTAAQTHNIIGNVASPSGAGATVTLSGSANATTKADGSGNYTFAAVYPGSYIVAPTGFPSILSPATQAVTVGSTDLSNVNFAVPTLCPCSTIWPTTTIPSTVDSGDPHPYELGLKFQADRDGDIMGVRFYKSASNTGVHIGDLWSSNGTLLATATFTAETVSGWQQVLFTSPVHVTQGTTYVVSYFVPSGHYSVNGAFFSNSGFSVPPLEVPSSAAASGNGVYSTAPSSAYPANSYNGANYWVDVILGR